jgi:hypothetical protein
MPAPLDKSTGEVPSGPPPRGSTVDLFANRMFRGNVGYNRRTVWSLAAERTRSGKLRTLIETTAKERELLYLISTDCALSSNGGYFPLQTLQDFAITDEMKTVNDEIRAPISGHVLTLSSTGD